MARGREESEAIIILEGRPTTQQPEQRSQKQSQILLPMPEFSLGFPHLTYMYVPRTIVQNQVHFWFWNDGQEVRIVKGRRRQGRYFCNVRRQYCKLESIGTPTRVYEVRASLFLYIYMYGTGRL